MGTFDSFHAERTASWVDISDSIRSSVTMDDVLTLYCPSLPRRRNRCPCPLHNGKDYNFSYNTHGYKCFVCGASGDVIGFVKEVCELSTRPDAMSKINADFRLNLPINCTISATQSANLALKRAEIERERAKRQAWEEQYHALMDEWVRLDRATREADPESDEYTYAVKNINMVSYELDALLDAEPR